MSMLTSPYRRHMLVVVGALKRTVGGWVTIHTSRMRQQFPDFYKDRPSALSSVRN
jgi:hypothetical protein